MSRSPLRKSARKPIKRTVANQSMKNDHNNWTDSEVEILVKAIQKHGHRDYEAILADLPTKTVEDYQKFLYSASLIAKTNVTYELEDIQNVNEWLKTCEAERVKRNVKGYAGAQEVAIILQLLSVDGPLENHPLPEDSGGIDFAACYRLLSQAVLGHPIQPINDKSIKFIYETFKEVCAATDLNLDLIDRIKDLLLAKSNIDVPVSDVGKLYNTTLPAKSVRVYQRKKRDEGSTSAQPAASSPKISEIGVISPPERGVTRPTQSGLLDDVAFNPLRFPSEWLYNSELNIKYPPIKGNKWCITIHGNDRRPAQRREANQKDDVVPIDFAQNK